MNIECIRCKGRNFCQRPYCTLSLKLSAQKRFNEQSKEDFFGKSPNVFVGKFGYPNVNVGILSAQDYKNNDDVPNWMQNKLEINDIINLRMQLVNSQFKANIKNFNDKFLEISKEISLAQKPVDIEVNLEKKPQFQLTFAQEVAPYGPNVKIKKAKITENAKIPQKVEKVVNDELKANDALKILNEKGIDEHYLAKIFSMGNLGISNDKKIVPTRWSITAIDDNLGKHIIDEIKNYPQHEYAAFFGSHFGNYFLILLMPDNFSYELFETYAPKNAAASDFTTDYENFNGRKEYAHETAGGYYAARMAILEYLRQKKKKASALCLRFITEEYLAPMGVWVVREATRNAMNSKPIIFKDKKDMLNYAKDFVAQRFKYDLSKITKESKLLREAAQPKLGDFF